MPSLVYLVNEFGRQFYGGVGTVVGQQVAELRRRGIPVEVLVWAENPKWKAEVFTAEGARPVSKASELLAALPKDALVVDHLYADHPVRRLIPRRLQYEHSLRGARDATQVYSPRRYARADAVVCVSEGEREAFVRRYPQHAHKAECVPNGYSPPETEPSPARDQTIGYLGRNVPMKRVELVLEGARQSGLPLRMSLAAAGGMPLPAEQLAGLDVTLFHDLSQAELARDFWPHIGLLCVPSAYEPFGMVAIEALSRGIPVLAARTGGLAEIMEAGQDASQVPPGLLFESDGLSAEAARQGFLARLAQWQQLSPGQRFLMSRAARHRARAFSAETMVNQLLAVIQRRFGIALP